MWQFSPNFPTPCTGQYAGCCRTHISDTTHSLCMPLKHEWQCFLLAIFSYSTLWSEGTVLHPKLILWLQIDQKWRNEIFPITIGGRGAGGHSIKFAIYQLAFSKSTSLCLHRRQHNYILSNSITLQTLLQPTPLPKYLIWTPILLQESSLSINGHLVHPLWILHCIQPSYLEHTEYRVAPSLLKTTPWV